MNEYWSKALGEISDKHLNEAIRPKRKSRIYWIGAAAAVLAVVLLAQSFPALIGMIPLADPEPVRLTGTVQPIQATVLAQAAQPRIPVRPDDQSSEGAAWDDYLDQVRQTEAAAETACAQALPFYKSASALFLDSPEQENGVWSPVSVYMDLAMLAEATAGSSRQQILDALGIGDIETLRSSVSALWETFYEPLNGNESCVFANSLWLEDGVAYDRNTVDTLAYDYYADVYRGDLGSEAVNADIRAWLNNKTGGLLSDAVKDVGLDPRTDPLIALYSTVYFQTNWSEQFDEADNTTRLFHSPDGAELETFMNQTAGTLYWGDSFSAVRLWLRVGTDCGMWLILPDEDKTVSDVLAEGQYLDMISAYTALDPSWENTRFCTVNLSVPKFDVSAEFDMLEGLQALGITDAFDPALADLSASITDRPAYVNQANHAARVVIDEEGITAAAYTEIDGAAGFMPPDELTEIDFILDRPFLFVIASEQTPLFIGVVNEP